MSDEHAGGQIDSQAALPVLGAALGESVCRPLKPGVLVADKYRLEAVLGRGAMGAVWAATHLGLGGPVALKFIDPRFAASPEARYRFETEARATAKIRSRFVVSVFDIGQLPDGTLYLVMERLRGETLHAYVKRQGPLPLDEAVGYVCQVGRALGHAHGRGVIHRDIKPSNIFLADTPDDGRIAKVLDFGVAKLSSPLEGWTAAGQTSAGVLLGTPQYMSPEQARGQGGVDHRADIYSLGLVFFRMFTGRPLRSPGPLGDLIARILTQPLPKLSDFRLDAPKAMDDWFARACAADAGDRFESVEACVEALVNASGLKSARFVAGPGRAPGPTGRLRGHEIDELRRHSGDPAKAFGAGPAGDAVAGDEAGVTGGAVLPSTGGGALPWGRPRHPMLAWGLGTLTVAITCAALGAMLSRAMVPEGLPARRGGPGELNAPAALLPPEPTAVATHDAPAAAPADAPLRAAPADAPPPAAPADAPLRAAPADASLQAAPTDAALRAAPADASAPGEAPATQPVALSDRTRGQAAAPARANVAPRAGTRPKASTSAQTLDLGY
ncbi:MAG TPA: serine/threonine-protein kinase [Polyangiaceae bacterium]|nr:serine/threonine-protein kinase [Polyangiaceae bacterium]